MTGEIGMKGQMMALTTAKPAAAEVKRRIDNSKLRLGLLKALANPVRLELLAKLLNCPGGESWGNLCAKQLLSQPAMSHHLIKLVEAGVILETKIGTQKSYRLNKSLLEQAGININKLVRQEK